MADQSTARVPKPERKKIFFFAKESKAAVRYNFSWGVNLLLINVISVTVNKAVISVHI